MYRFLVLLLMTCLVFGCTPALDDSLRLHNVPPAVLLDQQQAFPEQDIPVIADAGILDLNDNMREFARQEVPSSPNKKKRLRGLLRAMIYSDNLKINYHDDETYTASETFERQRGNCLSFTNLFVALARNAGLDVRYQMVDVPPSWSRESDLVMLARHINVLVDLKNEGERIVDFNEVRHNANYPSRLVSDSYAFAQYYNNLGALQLQDKNYPLAFAYFRKALETDRSMPQAWSNLGALYSRLNYFQHAESAYHQALFHDPKEKVALSNLVRLYKHLDEPRIAEHYENRVRRFRDSNPYYHHHLSKQAFADNRYLDARKHLKRAIELRPQEHIFYQTKADILLADKNIRGALKALQNARARAETKVAKSYQQRIDTLQANLLKR